MLIVVVIMLSFVGSAWAQSPVASSSALQPVLSAGQELRVTDEEGRRTQGKLVSISGAELAMNVPRLFRHSSVASSKAPWRECRGRFK